MFSIPPTMSLPPGRYRLLHERPGDSQYWPDRGGKKVGDARVTATCELRTPPEEVAFIWKGDIVHLDPPNNYAIIIPTGEARMFIRTLGVDGLWYHGWVTYQPFPTTQADFPWWAFEGASDSSNEGFTRHQ